ncbi:hypothetical protein B0H19DRAFT_133353 [Mycena capillaripes]|nr:hypothetical protein B0H19DRAFT_133353 [Mycena capillaripes]
MLIITEPHILYAIQAYIDILDQHDAEAGTRLPNTRADFFARLRIEHPTLSQGHRYQLRYIPITKVAQEPYEPSPVLFRNVRIHTTPYSDLPICTSYANPLFVMLNGLQHIESKFPSLTWDSWSWDHARWLQWIQQEDALSLLADDVGKELAAFLVVAGRLRQRMGQDFRWEVHRTSGATRLESGETPSEAIAQQWRLQQAGNSKKENVPTSKDMGKRNRAYGRLKLGPLLNRVSRVISR